MSAATQEDKLLRMANQIAAFFRSYPEEEAVAAYVSRRRAERRRGKGARRSRMGAIHSCHWPEWAESVLY